MKDVRRVLSRATRMPTDPTACWLPVPSPARAVGGFRYYGTRPDDPNDVVPHEHRRELRALKVFGAWTNMTDMKAGNTLDMVITENGRGTVRHYLQDVGSTFGTGALERKEPDDGPEHIYEGSSTREADADPGVLPPTVAGHEYPEEPESAAFEADRFEPEAWQPRVPAGAVVRARDDDTFWAALRVMAFSDELIRAAVKRDSSRSRPRKNTSATR